MENDHQEEAERKAEEAAQRAEEAERKAEEAAQRAEEAERKAEEAAQRAEEAERNAEETESGSTHEADGGTPSQGWGSGDGSNP